MKKHLVSIVVPTFNSKVFLDECLRSVRRQTYSSIEIIIVDNYSQDSTRDIAERYSCKVVLYKGLRSAARNVGIKISKGKYILSIDSDMELTPDVIRACIAEIENGFDAIIVPEFSVGNGYWAQCKALEKDCYIGDDLIEAARFFKKSVLERISGYDSKLEAGEDWDLNQRIKSDYRIGRTNAFIKHHEGRLSLGEAINKKYQYGKTLHKYKEKHPKEAKQQLTVIRPAFLKNWRKLCGDPSHALGMFFMKTCEYAAGFFGYLEAKMNTNQN